MEREDEGCVTGAQREGERERRAQWKESRTTLGCDRAKPTKQRGPAHTTRGRTCSARSSLPFRIATSYASICPCKRSFGLASGDSSSSFEYLAAVSRAFTLRCFFPTGSSSSSFFACSSSPFGADLPFFFFAAAFAAFFFSSSASSAAISSGVRGGSGLSTSRK